MKTKNGIRKIYRSMSIALFVGIVFSSVFPMGVYGATTLTAGELAALMGNNTSVVPGVDRPYGNSDAGAGASLTNKQQGPMVKVVFSGSNFQKGSEVKATAVPSGFADASDVEKLYFTWYLKHSYCGLSSSDDPGDVARCDLDGDGRIKENDWKIAAARIIIKGDFDKTEVDYSKFSNNSVEDLGSGVEAVPAVVNSSGVDGWVKTVKPEENNEEGAPNCYVQEPESGVIYELRKTEPVFNGCPDINGVHYQRTCIDKSVAQCDVLNPDFNPLAVPTNQAEIDQAIIDGVTPPDPIYNPANANIKTITATADVCAVKNVASTNEKTKSDDGLFTCKIENETDLRDFKASAGCGSNGIAMCVPADNSSLSAKDISNGDAVKGKIFGKDTLNNNNNTCSDIFLPNNNVAPLNPPPNFLSTKTALFNYSTYEGSSGDCSVLKSQLVDGTKNDDGSVAIAGNADYNPSCSFEKKENLCKHLFPYYKDEAIGADGKTVDLSGAKLGDGKFTLAEKQFWGGDPASKITNGQQKDEAAIMGLGVDSFSWAYSEGDMVGVAVEGTSMLPTDHADSSYRTMWAFSAGKCEKLKDLADNDNIPNSGDLNERERGFYIEEAGNNKIGILTANFDLNDCLEENLLEPDEDGFSNLSVMLNALPENPINDPSGKGDTVTVTASASNAQTVSNLFYEWKIQKSLDGSSYPMDETTWVDITNEMRDSYKSFTSADQQALGNNKFSFALNLPEDFLNSGIPSNLNKGVYYLKVKVKIRESSGEGSQSSAGEVIIKVYQQRNEIVVYPVVATSAGKLNLSEGTEVCSGVNNPEEKTRCYVTKNEIIGVKIPNTDNSNKLSGFSWKINGNPVQCNANVSSECSDPAGNVLFFPILGNEGESVNVIATAKNINTGETVEVSRHFVIIAPQTRITSLDNASVWPKLLGYYKDLDGNKYPDYSQSVLETQPGNTITLGAAVYPAWKAGQAGFDWTIDGEIQSIYSNQNQISFVVDKTVGESYNIGLIAKYDPGKDNQANNMRKALLRNWGISPEEVIEETVGANGQIDVVEGQTLAKLDAGKKGLTASLITHLPEQFMFLLKITLTTFAMLLSAGLLFAFIPETVFKETE